MLRRKFDYSLLSSSAIGSNISLYSLDTFRRKLEKEYFAEVNIGVFDSDEKRSNLVVEFQSNFSLAEFLYEIQRRNVAQVNQNDHEDFKDLAFSKALKHLRGDNIPSIGLEELHFSLRDCEITIKMIYPNSIEDQLGNIYKMLERHYLHFTHGNTKLPSEIFIPVFEENLDKDLRERISAKDNLSNKKDYFNFWGIYFSHNDDAVIYDLKKRSNISGDLRILSE
ncbi:MAG: hypothetical protein HKN89_05650 [Eudoraea sp.]|nr:hypothetical protein [Eudoraea sp.]